MKKKNQPTAPEALGGFAADITDTALKDALSQRYLAYALSTIMGRALPDVRDGLKPVHRRLLYAMRVLRLAADEPPKKSARVVGDVIGKFHPHGDVAVYEALVRLAQDFSARYPLVDGQGNFGNIDGDNAAAMRYTEARLTAVAEALLKDLDADTVDFRATYDDSGEEPVVLPAAFPNLLANGASGIAVGLATNIPPHNVDEVCAALRQMISQPNCSLDKLMKHLPGPDFPTGGIITEDAATLRAAYAAGRGSLRVRARWQKEDLERGAWQIVVTEMPYQVPKARLVERIAELLLTKKLPLLDDVRDESAEDVRLVLVPKNRSTEPAALMASLFRQTELQVRFSLNMNVLDAAGTPQLMGLPAILRAFLDHRMVVLERKSNYRLAQIAQRLEMLAGLLIAFLNLDAIIKIIRNEDEPKPVLMRKFSLSDAQAEAILNTRLRALRKLEEVQIKAEHKALTAEQAQLKKLLQDSEARWQQIDGEVQEIQRQFGKKTELGKRRTEISAAEPEADFTAEEQAVAEPLTLLLSEKGWIRTLKGHQEDLSGISYKEGDRARFNLKISSIDKILLFATNGRFYTLEAGKLPGGRGFGEPVRLLCDLNNEADILAMRAFQPAEKYLVASSDGRGFVVRAEDALAETRKGKQVLNVSPPAEAAGFCLLRGDHVAVMGTHRKMLLFPIEQVPEMARGRGITLQKYKDAQLSDIMCLTLKDGLSWQSGGREKFEKDLRPYVGERAQAGRMAPTGFPKNNRFR